ncbi:MAG: Tim44 domain-containing protein [Alphaproteobacteria bacterium]|nr:Tim44 domain-containing protein [Alphaproteobacteria bacterium]
MPADLIVYALVAAGLIVWLRSILGTRHGDEPERPAPYLKPEGPAGRNMELAGSERRVGPEERISELAKTPKGNVSIADTTAEQGLIEIARADRSFDIDRFAQGAQDAFVYIVESFADGDRETLRDLLSPSVFAAFDEAISARLKAAEVMHAEINAINKAEITSARIEGRFSKITVRFVAEEITYTKNSEGQIIEGHPERITQMRDLWTFSRETRSRDPRWLVTETLIDTEGDNPEIPNASDA